MLVKPDNNIHKEGTKLFNHYIVDWTHWTSNTENHFYMISIFFLFFSISRCVNQSILTLIWNSQKKTSEYVEIRKFVICIHRLLLTEIVANLICDVVTEIGRTMMNIFIAVLVFYVTWIHSINVFSCFTCATKIKLLLLIEEDHHGNHVYVCRCFPLQFDPIQLRRCRRVVFQWKVFKLRIQSIGQLDRRIEICDVTYVIKIGIEMWTRELEIEFGEIHSNLQIFFEIFPSFKVWVKILPT